MWSYFGFAVNDLPNDFASAAKVRDFAESGAKAQLEAKQLPLLVCFADDNSPSTFKRVDPQHLDACCPGAQISQFAAEITTDTVLTRGVEAKLPWLTKFRENHAKLDGETRYAIRVDGPLTERLSSGDFVVAP